MIINIKPQVLPVAFSLKWSGINKQVVNMSKLINGKNPVVCVDFRG